MEGSFERCDWFCRKKGELLLVHVGRKPDVKYAVIGGSRPETSWKESFIGTYEGKLWMVDRKEKSWKQSFEWLNRRGRVVRNALIGWTEGEEKSDIESIDWLTRRRPALKSALIGWPEGDRRMRGMCDKEEEENRERFNPWERQQQVKKILENQSIKNLIRASLILHLHYAYIHLAFTRAVIPIIDFFTVSQSHSVSCSIFD